MCARYFMEESPELRPIVEAMNRSPLTALFDKNTVLLTHGEIRPSNAAPVIAPDKAGRQAVFPMKWGFSGKTLLFNARTETAAEKPTFRESWAFRRCAVPASWYYEWEHFADVNGKMRTGDKYKICPEGYGITWLCGLYRMEEGIPCFVILTREPGEGIRFIHDRMPLILPETSVREWIRPGADPKEIIRAALTEMQYEKVG